jgi:hypothetical protein
MKHALAGALAMLLAMGLVMVVQGQRAEEEREARLEAEQRASQAGSAARALADSLAAVRAERAREDSVHAAALLEAQEAARIAEASATERTRRLRETLTTEQQRELDGITAFWQEAVAEERRATESALSRLRLAEAEAADNMTLVLAERESVNRWQDAYAKAEAEIDALRKPSFGIALGDVPVLAVAIAGTWLLAR